MDVAHTLQGILDVTGWNQDRLAKKIGVSQGTVSKWRNQQQVPNLKQWEEVVRAFSKDARTQHLFVVEAKRSVPVMGRIGAGALINPEFDQIPPEGLFSVDLPFPIPDDMIGLEVDGDSMLPRYDDGDIVVVWREQRRATESYIGQEAAVRTGDGLRYLKNIARGPRRGLFTLNSFNARPIEAVELAWVGEIYVTVRAGQIKKMVMADKARARRKRSAREEAGTSELALGDE